MINSHKEVITLPRKEVKPKQAAEMLGSSVGYVYTLMKDGELDHRLARRRDKERGTRWITVASIERFLAKREVEA